MSKRAIEIAVNFLHKEGISETRGELWRRFANWSKHIKFNDAETAAAAIISGDYDVESAYSLNDMKNFYFNGGIVA